jgi:hypothetical protein
MTFPENYLAIGCGNATTKNDGSKRALFSSIVDSSIIALIMDFHYFSIWKVDDINFSLSLTSLLVKPLTDEVMKSLMAMRLSDFSLKEEIFLSTFNYNQFLSLSRTLTFSIIQFYY